MSRELKQQKARITAYNKPGDKVAEIVTVGVIPSSVNWRRADEPPEKFCQLFGVPVDYAGLDPRLYRKWPHVLVIHGFDADTRLGLYISAPTHGRIEIEAID